MPILWRDNEPSRPPTWRDDLTLMLLAMGAALIILGFIM